VEIRVGPGAGKKKRVSGDVKWGAGSCGCSGFVFGQKRGERLPDGWGAAAGCFGGEKSKPGKGGCLKKNRFRFRFRV